MIKDCDLQVNLDPPEDKPIYCPCCGDEAQEIYLVNYRTPVGCDKCVTWIDAYDWQEQNKE